MNLSEMIRRYGDDKVEFQPLDKCMDGLKSSKGGMTKVTFGTLVPFGLDGLDKFGIVVWFDRDTLAKTVADSKAEKPEDLLHGRKSDSDYLRDLAGRLRNVPVMHGTDQFDSDVLLDMARRLEGK